MLIAYKAQYLKLENYIGYYYFSNWISVSPFSSLHLLNKNLFISIFQR